MTFVAISQSLTASQARLSAETKVMNEQEIFEVASRITNKDERRAFLRTACQGNQDQHIRIEAFIQSELEDEPLPEALPSPETSASNVHPTL